MTGKQQIIREGVKDMPGRTKNLFKILDAGKHMQLLGTASSCVFPVRVQLHHLSAM